MEDIEKQYKEVEKMTIKQLPKYLKKLFKKAWTYNSTIYNNSIAMYATYNAIQNEKPSYGTTGFQNSAIMWEMVRKLNSLKPPLRLLNYHDMLYPQMNYKFTTITTDVYKFLREEAKKLIEETDKEKDIDSIKPHIDVYNHWKLIVEGKIPFGFTIERSD